MNLNFTQYGSANGKSILGRRHHSLTLAAGLLAAALLFTIAGVPTRSQNSGGRRAAAPAGNADNGKQLFASAGCAACHGPMAKGMTGMGPQIAPPPLAPAEFVNFVRQPSGGMRPFSKDEISDSQLADVYAYLQSLSPTSGASSAMAAAPAGDAAHGKQVFVADGCYECHGYAGQGGSGSGPKLGPHPIAFSAFITQLRHPREEMPPYTDKVISDSDVADIYAFLSSLPEPPKVDSISILTPATK